MNHIEVPVIINKSGMSVNANRFCPNLKSRDWIAIDEAMTGDAPKDFLAVYEYGAGSCRRANRRTWPRYIAKVGHKWYPNESVTEHLITRIGQAIGMEIAESRLAHVKGQLRFLSRYFLSSQEYLLHGADLFASYLQDHGREFVEAVENENKAPEYFDYDFAVDSIKAMVPQSADEVRCGFNRMLAFDALVGNNDRHFFNWAVICHPESHHPPRFSPIYDTARALFWNHTEEKLSKMNLDGRRPEDVLRKYCRNSSSKIGVAGVGRVNHFQLLESIFDRSPEMITQFNILNGIDREPVDLVGEILREEFRNLVSPLRRSWICRLVEYRTEQFRRVLAGETTDV
ncbi:HipA domain-containing protein [Rhodopirellula sp. P2]|uniref:HipA domain-containing protein n=1 Tax=Rhodopirellula sp. P2 TaxID=2127060 RepID=UPI002367FF7E|nr:HipA domain-containing protein [Rhodopirellula sp. P2]WDQ16791.1 HipA domain-containing protein [Rhodopirellula sp. P2]